MKTSIRRVVLVAIFALLSLSSINAEELVGGGSNPRPPMNPPHAVSAEAEALIVTALQIVLGF